MMPTLAFRAHRSFKAGKGDRTCVFSGFQRLLRLPIIPNLTSLRLFICSCSLSTKAINCYCCCSCRASQPPPGSLRSLCPPGGFRPPLPKFLLPVSTFSSNILSLLPMGGLMVGVAASLTNLYVKLVGNSPSICSLWVDTATRWDNPTRGKHEKQTIERKEDYARKIAHCVAAKKQSSAPSLDTIRSEHSFAVGNSVPENGQMIHDDAACIRLTNSTRNGNGVLLLQPRHLPRLKLLRERSSCKKGKLHCPKL